MKRIMIVDDEFLVRVGIKSMLDWEKEGYSIVCEAENGRDAIEKLEQYKPQIILTDLVMEPISGLELIKYCASKYPYIQIVVLSNYNDFDKVKSAMKSGARDFLFKLTTNQSELLGILGDISRDIDQRRLLDDGAGTLLNRSAGAIRQRLIQIMISSGYESESNLLQELQIVEVKCDFTRPYAILYVDVANYSLFEGTDETAEHKFFAVSLENIIDELMSRKYRSQTFRNENGHYIVVVNIDLALPHGDFQSAMVGEFERITEYAERYFGARISAALSAPFRGFGGVPPAVASCRNLIKDAFFLKEPSLLLPSQATGRSGETGGLPTWDLNTLQNLLDHFQIGEARDFIARSVDACFGMRGLEPYSVREKLHDLYRVIKQDSLGKGIVLENIVDGNGLSLYQAILRYDLLSDISDSFSGAMRRYEEECGKIGGRRLKKEIAKIIVYVSSNLGKELTVANVAGMANMSESYFSHLFKTEMGVSFVDYLNHLRIGKAKDLLLHSDLRINEIACQVGIGNPNYFSILFRKLEGASPVEFRNSHLRG